MSINNGRKFPHRKITNTLRKDQPWKLKNSARDRPSDRRKRRLASEARLSAQQVGATVLPGTLGRPSQLGA
eukprot:scaffold25776_cov106-Isochrysis_galbana.AAC.3